MGIAVPAAEPLLPFPEVSEIQLIERYKKHNEEVEQYFRDRLQDILFVSWEEGAGWKELCEFLGKDIPNEPFPHANKGKYSKRAFNRVTAYMKSKLTK